MYPCSIFNHSQSFLPIKLVWIDFLTEFDFLIVHKRGTQNVMADALSRQPQLSTMVAVPVSLVMDEIKDALKHDLSTQQMLAMGTTTSSTWLRLVQSRIVVYA